MVKAVWAFLTRPVAWGAVIVAYAFMLVVLVLVINNIHVTNTERNARADQGCQRDEQAHFDEVQNLKQTYEFLGNLPPSKYDDPLYQFIVLQLPTTEREAINDADNFGVIVPDYCDEPGLGRDEPDPAVPQRTAAADQAILLINDTIAKGK